MTRYADPLRCPDCGASLEVGAARCHSCGLNLSGPTAVRLFATLTEADRLIEELRAPPSVLGPGAPAPLGPAQIPAPQARPPRPRRPFSGATVPKILLSLGAICLLAAALVFLAVNWERLGVGGRTVALIVFTLVAAGVATWAARHRLRAALESLGLVAYGLLVLDLVGAQRAGWLGSIDVSETLIVVGVVVVACGLGGGFATVRLTGMRFTSSEVVTTLGAAAAVIGATAVGWWTLEYRLAVTVIILLGAAQLARSARQPVATTGIGVVWLGTWLGLVARGIDLAAGHQSWHDLWVDTRGWPLMLAAAVPWFAQSGPAVPTLVRRAFVGLGGIALLTLIELPSTDERPETWLLTALALLAASAIVTRSFPDPVGPGWALPTGLGTLAGGLLVGTDAAIGVARLEQAAARNWEGAFSGHVSRLQVPADLPSAAFAGLAALAVLVAVQSLVNRVAGWPGELVATRFGVGVVALVSWLGLVSLDVPVWTWVASGLALTVAGVGDWLFSRSPVSLTVSAVFAVAVAFASLYATGLTLMALGVIAVCAATVMYLASGTFVPALAGAVAMGAAAGSVWSYGGLRDDDVRWTSFAALAALALLALLHAALTHRGAVRLPTLVGVELGAAMSTPLLIPAGLQGTSGSTWPFWLSAYLTIVGTGVCLVGLAYPPHRALLWPGGFVLAVASWVRLGDLGVETPEAYTLPWALVLLGVGGFHVLRRGASSMSALGPGLGLGLLPSLLWSLNDPLTPRSTILGAACLALVLGGAWGRWAGPLVYGAAAGAVLVVRLASPYIAEAVPRWVIIGTAGALLVAVGLTWERRLSQARHTWRYLRGLQ